MSDKLTVTFEGESRELLMSYGLLNALTSIVGGPEVAAQINMHQGIREDVLKAVLAERKPTGKLVKDVADMDDLDISIEDIEKILDWVSEAVLAFFVRSLGKMVKRVDENKELLEGLKSSLAGLQA